MKRIAGLLCLLLVVSACQPRPPSPLEKAREAVSIGDSREDAIEILGAEAWYHQPCQYRGSVDDLFFYGDQRYDKADIVIVFSVVENGEYRVVNIGSFETYLWHKQFADCIDRDRFKD